MSCNQETMKVNLVHAGIHNEKVDPTQFQSHRICLGLAEIFPCLELGVKGMKLLFVTVSTNYVSAHHGFSVRCWGSQMKYDSVTTVGIPICHVWSCSHSTLIDQRCSCSLWAPGMHHCMQ